MADKIKKQHSASFKAQVVVEALKELKTLSQLASDHSIHPTQVRRWKQQAEEGIKSIFEKEGSKTSEDQEKLIEELYKQIGQQKVELDWLKKKTGHFSPR